MTLNATAQTDSTCYPASRVALEVQYIRTAKTYQQLKRLLAIMPESSPQWNFIPSILPIKIFGGRISSKFGYRIHPIDGIWKFHNAIDIPCSLAENIYATASGLVVVSVNSSYGLGNHIVIDQINGFQTIYGHLSYCLVHSGAFVKKGQLIGLAGSTGKSNGVHVHYGIKKDAIGIDPYPFCFVSNLFKKVTNVN